MHYITSVSHSASSFPGNPSRVDDPSGLRPVAGAVSSLASAAIRGQEEVVGTRSRKISDELKEQLRRDAAKLANAMRRTDSITENARVQGHNGSEILSQSEVERIGEEEDELWKQLIRDVRAIRLAMMRGREEHPEVQAKKLVRRVDSGELLEQARANAEKLNDRAEEETRKAAMGRPNEAERIRMEALAAEERTVALEFSRYGDERPAPVFGTVVLGEDDESSVPTSKCVRRADSGELLEQERAKAEKLNDRAGIEIWKAVMGMPNESERLGRKALAAEERTVALEFLRSSDVRPAPVFGTVVPGEDDESSEPISRMSVAAPLPEPSVSPSPPPKRRKREVHDDPISSVIQLKQQWIRRWAEDLSEKIKTEANVEKQWVLFDALRGIDRLIWKEETDFCSEMRRLIHSLPSHPRRERTEKERYGEVAKIYAQWEENATIQRDDERNVQFQRQAAKEAAEWARELKEMFARLAANERVQLETAKEDRGPKREILYPDTVVWPMPLPHEATAVAAEAQAAMEKSYADSAAGVVRAMKAKRARKKS